MLKSIVHAVFGTTILFAAATSASATPSTIIFATLFDKGADKPMALDHGLGMANMKMGPDMGIRLSSDTAKAGTVTFKVANASKELVHEMLVLPYADGKPLPYDGNVATVDEKKAGSLGEVSETDPGKGGELKLSLKPGKYAVLCNIPGHFADGMWAVLTVK